MPALDHFPVVPGKFEKPYKSQEGTITAVEKAFKDYRYVILESPVGSGKSAIALTLARAMGDAHVLIPRKSLQDQYFSDFEEFVTLMKGRSSYPCGFYKEIEEVDEIFDKILTGSIQPPQWGETTCAEGPCKDNERKHEECLERIGTCPYMMALGVAQDHKLVIHNFWSFIYQGYFAGRFNLRKLLVVDEAHMMEGILRDFTVRNLNLPGNIPESDTQNLTDVEAWVDWVLSKKELHPKDKDEHEKFLAGLEKLANFPDKTPIISREYREDGDFTRYSFTPRTLGGLPEELVFQYGEKVLLMSGTIYDKTRFCQALGINPEDACFIRTSSSFPVRNRPVYVKDDYMVDLSYKAWNSNLQKMGEIINRILDTFHDVKGLIHAPSYHAIGDIMKATLSPRLIGHDKFNFPFVLEQFYNSENNDVLVSPICQQGVDFKGDRARFQIILRVPFLNVSDPFTEYKMRNDFPWYNYQSLLTFGQMLGRVNRGPDDFGVTVLVDSRFGSFIRRNSKYLPQWQKEAFIYK